MSKPRVLGMILGAVVGVVPGVALVLLAGLISGEAELTLGVGGLFLGLIGLVVGAAFGARRRSPIKRP